MLVDEKARSSYCSPSAIALPDKDCFKPSNEVPLYTVKGEVSLNVPILYLIKFIFYAYFFSNIFIGIS